MSGLVLYTYSRSSAAYRVRIALNLKGLDYEPRPVHLLKAGGEHRRVEYQQLNPQGLVPTLIDNGIVLTQSLAIIEYLEEAYPEPSLLPKGARDRAYVRALAQIIACDIHPLNNLRVLDYLRDMLGHHQETARRWIHHWIHEGFRAFEAHLKKSAVAGQYCFGDTPTLADVCLVPQVYNARRFECDLNPFPLIQAIDKRCMGLAAFQKAAPENQLDA